MAENAVNSLAPANISSSELGTETPCLFGGSSSMIPASKASTAPYSETNHPISPQTLSDRLTPLLISAGLVKGITHTSVRKQSVAAIRDSALWPLDGGDAE
jgi:hypothetical protein